MPPALRGRRLSRASYATTQAVAQTASDMRAVVRHAKYKELSQVSTLLAEVFQREYCIGPFGWLQMAAIRREILIELKRQWELKAMKRIVALSEARAGKHASSREVSKGAHHAILVAVDEASGELLGCVEVREMRGYLRPRELVDVPAQSDDQGEDDSKPEVNAQMEFSLRAQRNRPPWPYMANLAVTTQARKRGVGRALVSEAEKTVSSWGFRELVLKVESTNDVANTMYERMGYCEVHAQAGYKVQGDSVFGKVVPVTHLYLQRLFVWDTSLPTGS
eukprot:CAMPEP_0114259856 /NCGR_PEP_ID=MMETSP0058-20121206/20126_1 /TAXON_ID=36894 /ORGANISM="Pyramimonas parkeae, CCMP726" /LENGTH=277 /DNA_ID=CAMNT_0001374951 /DNA_START=66 /DNA_END=899 /DNA_ORIENTATION=-